MTLAEVLLWTQLKQRRMAGYDFDRQRPLDEYIVDFYCKDLLLAIEVDGRSHDFKRDRDGARQRRLESLGIRFLRFWEYEVKNEMASVVSKISDWIGEHQSEFVESKKSNSLKAGEEPTPNPSKEGSSGSQFPSRGERSQDRSPPGAERA